MIHELDHAIRHYAAGRPSAPRPAGGSSCAQPRPRGDGFRLGLGPLALPMQSSRIRVLETTWRLWREPQVDN